MADKANNPTKVITGKCRLSFEHIWKPSKMDEDSQAKYSASIIIPKTDAATLAKIKAAQEAAVKDGVQSKWEGKKPAKLKLPLRDGDEDRPDDPNYVGCYFLNATSNNKSGIVDLSRQEISVGIVFRAEDTMDKPEPPSGYWQWYEETISNPNAYEWEYGWRCSN